MNKSMLTGVVAGIAVATAGGVAGYQFFGQPRADQQGSAVAVQDSVVEPQTVREPVVARAEPAAQPRSQSSASTQSRPAARPATPAPKTAAPPAEECWDEEVTVQEEQKDPNAIAGTAVGAVVGGAIGKDVGDRNLTTAAGAAAGAFIGRKIQKKIQENHADQRTTTRVEHHCAPAGTPH